MKQTLLAYITAERACGSSGQSVASEPVSHPPTNRFAVLYCSSILRVVSSLWWRQRQNKGSTPEYIHLFNLHPAQIPSPHDIIFKICGRWETFLPKKKDQR